MGKNGCPVLTNGKCLRTAVRFRNMSVRTFFVKTQFVLGPYQIITLLLKSCSESKIMIITKLKSIYVMDLN